MKKRLKINDPKVLAVKIIDNGEPLVDVEKSYKQLFYDKTREGVFKYNKAKCLFRKSVVKKLVRAQNLLPKGLRLKIKEGHRPLSVQKMIFNEHLVYLGKKWPQKSHAFLKSKAVEYVAPPDVVPPHSTGGAVDLTLMVVSGKELDMGKKINNSGRSSLTYAKNISANAKSNRKILIKAMEKAGFVNYSYEWWHWSYGDRYWAFIKKREFAIYNAIR